MAQAKKDRFVKEFKTLTEWKKEYLPLDISMDSFSDEFISKPNDLAVKLASEAIKRVENNGNLKTSAV